ncbi:MAG: hypothetical protein B9S34_01190 [Opitutia bacterium Tous-C1TDCM]|nr:MAG: hypothetical protein B9S34_01190 [Opitutae bacterium Tous-C1TDCM]
MFYIARQVTVWVRNIPHWDEYDTVLDFLLQLERGAGWTETLQACFAVNNEHRMLASRLLFAFAYWLGGGVDFALLAAAGNLFLLAAFGVLLAREGDPAARLRLAAVFSLSVFHLQHHESLFWAGSSIDHFFVVLAAVTALGALVSSGRAALPVATCAALLAGYSLAHGLLVWPVGFGLLLRQRRRQAALVWAALGIAASGVFLAGFEFNPGHRLPAPPELPAVLLYALRIAGSSPAVGHPELAPWFGAVLVVGFAAAAARRSAPREWFAVAVIFWCLAAIGLIAWGRALLANAWAPVASRYVILSSIAWGLFIWLLLERLLARRPGRAWWRIPVFGGLALGNVLANSAHAHTGRIFAAGAEQAVRIFRERGSFAQAATPPYPDPARADALIREAESRGIYRLPELEALHFARPPALPVRAATEIGDATYFIEDVALDRAEVRVRGWAIRRDETARPGDIAVVFRTPDQMVAYEALPQVRPDVAESIARWDGIHAGFELRLRRERLPQGSLQVGIGFDLARAPEFMMTAHTLENRRADDLAPH